MKYRNGFLAGLIAGTGLMIGLVASPVLAHQAPTSLEGLPLLEDVAADAVQISLHVPNMGAHWARESDLFLMNPESTIIASS